MRNKFDMQLERLNEQLTHMGKLCEIAINKATMALQNGDMAALKMITDMERIGDQASDIAEIIISARMTEAMDISRIGQMSEAAAKMVRDSVTAYVKKDLELSREVMASDDIVDEMFEENKRELVSFIAEKKGGYGERAIDLIMVAKYLERIADHATNIAEWVEFSITGIHKGMETMKPKEN